MKEKRWNWLMILLWAYSVLLIGFSSLISIFAPANFNYTTSTTQDSIVGGAMFLPVLIFILLVGIKNLK